MPFNFWPYTNFHDMNLDYLLRKTGEIDAAVKTAETAADNAVTSANSAGLSEVNAQNARDAAQEFATEAENQASASRSYALESKGFRDSAQSIADNIADPIGGIVTQWLNDNITQETGYVLDSSLSSASAAAPAKTVGDKTLWYRGQISDASSNPDSYIAIGTYYVNAATAAAWSTNYNFPFSAACRLTVIGGTGSSSGVCIQIAATENNVVYYRVHDISSTGNWGTWTFLPSVDNTLYYRGIVVDTTSSPGDFVQIGTYYVTASVAQAWNTNYNFPITKGCRFTVIGGTGSSAGVCMQIAHTAEPYVIYVRIHAVASGGAWGPWKSLAWTDDAITGVSPAMFPTIAVCGGSYDSGWTSNRANTAYSEVERNFWIKQVTEIYGNDYIMLARHGMSIPDFFSYSGSDGRGYPGLLSSNAADLYITTFATNDDEPLGGPEDMAIGYASGSNPSTFYGYYAKLIYEIRQKAPNAAIVLTTPESEGIIGTYTSKIAAIYEIASNYNLPVMNWHEDPAMKDMLPSFCRVIQGGTTAHPTSAGYSLIASAFPRVFSKCANAYPNYFSYYV